ncbi:hypothetical protein C8J56DRAFT_396511 [Mycena floridula]|nr:hypothetical protein C8J56DRAFT_396511 [Mycena floridula]
MGLAPILQLINSLGPSTVDDDFKNQIHSLNSSAIAVCTSNAVTAVLVLSLSLLLSVFKAPHFRHDAIATLYALFQLQVFILPVGIPLGHLFHQDQIGFKISVGDGVLFSIWSLLIWLSFRRRNKSLIAMTAVMSLLVIVAAVASFTFAIINTIRSQGQRRAQMLCWAPCMPFR